MNLLCPMKFGNSNKEIRHDEVGYECDGNQCSWWDDFTGHCAILNISRHGGKGSFNVLIEERKAEKGR